MTRNCRRATMSRLACGGLRRRWSVRGEPARRASRWQAGEVETNGGQGRARHFALHRLEQHPFFGPDVRHQQLAQCREPDFKVTPRITLEVENQRSYLCMLRQQVADQGVAPGQTLGGGRKDHCLFRVEVRPQRVGKEHHDAVNLCRAAGGPVRAWRRRVAADESLGDDERVVVIVRERNQPRVSFHVPTIQYGGSPFGYRVRGSRRDDRRCSSGPQKENRNA